MRTYFVLSVCTLSKFSVHHHVLVFISLHTLLKFCVDLKVLHVLNVASKCFVQTTRHQTCENIITPCWIGWVHEALLTCP